MNTENQDFIGEMERNRVQVIKEEDLIEAIKSLPNSPNGFSGAYSKREILLAIKKIPKYRLNKDWSKKIINNNNS